MKKLTEVRGLEVLDRNGRSLGRVHEVRCRLSPSHATRQSQPAIAELLCGSGGMRARFGIQSRKTVPVAWTDIVAIRRGKLWARIEKPAE